MRVIAELVIDSTFCLHETEEQMHLKNPYAQFELVIKNNPNAGPFARTALLIEMIFETQDLSTARSDALDNMAMVQNALARATGGRFDNVNVIRVIDWTPGIVDRAARYFATTRAAISAPELDAEFAKTIQGIMAMHNDDISQTVMRWYRLGRRAEGPEEQFMYLWFAVEVAAGALKEAGKISIKCPKCQSDLFCATCDETPMRRRVETEAIRELINSIAPAEADGDEIYRTLTKIRNTLHHGRRLNSIIDDLPCTTEQALDVVARIAWGAITRLAVEDADPMPDEALTFVTIENVTNNVMVLSSVVGTRFEKGDPNNPQLSEAPDINISMVIGDKNYTFDGQEIIDPPKDNSTKIAI